MAYDGKQDPKAGFKSKNFLASLEFALQGLRTALIDERNMRAHLVSACLAIVAGFIFKLTLSEWLWLVLAIFLVIVTELVNTIAENLVDMFTNYHFHSLGKKVKDMAAGVVLLTAIFAIFVGLVIFGPKLWHLIF